MGSLAQKVSGDINNAIEADNLVLPTMPEMALKVREVADDPNASIQQLAKVIGGDAALTARIIKVSNSALYRGANEIEDLNMALMRLGMGTTCNLATGLAMEQMFQATTDLVDKKLRDVWSASSEVAAICSVLCKHYTNLRPDQAALAGLVHSIGILPILSYTEDNPSLLKDSITLDAIIRESHPQIGVKILTAWDFPKDIQNVPLDYLNFSRKIPKADYSDLVTAATLQAFPKQYSDIDYSSVSSFERLGLETEVDSAQGVELEEEIAQAAKMFS